MAVFVSETASPIIDPSIGGHWRELYPFDSNYLQLPEVAGYSNGSQRLHYLDQYLASSLQANNSGGQSTDIQLTRSQHANPLTKPDAEAGVCLFVHGNPTWSFYWRNLITGLQNRYRCVAVDHVGCGLSDKPQDYPYTLEQHTANLVALIDHLDLQNITLVAHDWGGAIGLGAAVARRSRFAGLVLLNTGAFPPPFIPRRIQLCRVPVLGTLAIRGLNAFAAAALTMATERPHGLEPLVQAGLIAPYHDWQTRVAVDAFVKDIPWRPSHPTYRVLESLEKSLASLRELPAQLIWGMKDWCFTPECLKRFQTLFPQARTLEIPTAGHYVVEDAPGSVLEETRDFLATRVDPHV